MKRHRCAIHIHLLLRIRPDVAALWSDEEIARRWWRLHPGRRDEHDIPAEPTPAEIAVLMTDGEALAKRRQRLSSLSYFMAALCEPIARRANKRPGYGPVLGRSIQVAGGTR